MGLYVINKQMPVSVKILKVLIFVFVSSVVIGGYYLYKKHNENIEKSKIEQPLSNLTYEVERIEEMYGKENLEELELSGKTLTFKIKEDKSLEPLISRYQDMIEVIFNQAGYNKITINKKNIIDYKTLKKNK